LFVGKLDFTLGASSSFGPPLGVTICAQDVMIKSIGYNFFDIIYV
jgi:hypothetical protein